MIWKEWKFNINSNNSNLSYSSVSYKGHEFSMGIELFFGLNINEYFNLFDYNKQENNDVYEGSSSLSYNSPRNKVIDNLKKFIEKACANELHSQKE